MSDTEQSNSTEEKNYPLRDIILIGVNLLFVILILVLGSYNRFAADDFINFKNIRYLGFWDTFTFFYNAWNPRWTSNLFMNWMMLLFNPADSLFFYYFFLLILFVISVFRMLKNLLTLHNLKPGKFLLINFTLIFISGFFLLTFGIDETWFWMCASTIYILPVIFTCLGISFIFSSKSNFITYILMISSFLVAGGGSEPFAIVVIIILTTIIINTFRKNHFSINKLPGRFIIYKIMVASVVMLISFSINIFSPGDARRQTFLPPIDILHIVEAIGYSSLILLRDILIYKLIYIIPYLFLWSYFGAMIAKTKPLFVFDFFKIIKQVLLRLFVLSILTIILSSVMIRGIPPQRTLTVISFLMAIGIAIIGFVMGYMWSLSKIYSCKVFYAGGIAFILIFTLIIFIQFPIAEKHARFYDKRLMTLTTATRFSQHEAMGLAPLPPSGWLYHGDITSDTANNQNRDYRDAIGLHFNVYIDSTLTKPPTMDPPDMLIIRH